MSIDGLKTFLQTNAIYNGYWLVETSITDGEEPVASCTITPPQEHEFVGTHLTDSASSSTPDPQENLTAPYSTDALASFRQNLNWKLQNKHIILIDYTQGRILTCFTPSGRGIFDQQAENIPFTDTTCFHVSKIKDTEPLLTLFQKIFPDPAPSSSEP